MKQSLGNSTLVGLASQGSLSKVVFSAALVLSLACSAMGQKPTPPDPSQGTIDGAGKFAPAMPAKADSTPTKVEDLQEAATRMVEKTGETTFRVGKVNCDRATRTITVPVRLNAREGLIEYALVTTKGKVHESLLSTEASPLHIQIAALLLGLSPAPGKEPPVAVTISVEWESNGPRRSPALEELIALSKDSPQGKTGATLARRSWDFQGSKMEADGFAAEREGSIIALIGDPLALIGNPRPDHKDDTLHVPNAVVLPPSGLPLSLCIRPVPPTR